MTTTTTPTCPRAHVNKMLEKAKCLAINSFEYKIFYLLVIAVQNADDDDDGDDDVSSREDTSFMVETQCYFIFVAAFFFFCVKYLLSSSRNSLDSNGIALESLVRTLLR